MSNTTSISMVIDSVSQNETNKILRELRQLPDVLASLSNGLDDITYKRTTVPDQERVKTLLSKVDDALEVFRELTEILEKN